MDELSERGEAAGRALLELGGTASPGDIGRVAELGQTTQAKAIKDLVAAGLASKEGWTVSLTPAGWRAFSRFERRQAGRLGDALGFWPHPHRAAAELLLSAVIARHHFPEHDLPPGFVFIGPTGMGKTSVAGAVMELLGLDADEHTLMVPQQTESGLFGYTRPAEGGGFTYVPAPATRLPVVLFDEFDKGEPPVRMKVWTYFDRRRMVRNGELTELCPVPVIAANYPRAGDRYAHLRDEYLRRSITVDFAGPRQAVAHLERSLREFYRPPERPWRGAWRLEALRPADLDMAPIQGLLGAIPAFLSDPEGLERWNGVRALEALVRGRAALYPEASVEELGVMTVADYLTCVETVAGLVRPDWLPNLERVADSVRGATREEVLAALAGARRAREQRSAEARGAKVVKEAEDLEHVKLRSQFVAGIDRRLEGLHGNRLHRGFRSSPEVYDRLAGVREQLRRLKASAAKAGPERLAEIRQLAAGPLAEADELIGHSDQLRQAEERQRARLKAERDAARARHPAAAAAERMRQRQQKATLRSRLTMVQDQVRPLERLWDRRSTGREEKPLQVLLGVEVPNGGRLLRFEESAPTGQGLGAMVGRLSHAIAGSPGWWISTLTPEVRFYGTAGECTPLAVWGQNTQRVLEPLIAFWHAQEDQILAQMGRVSQRRRPTVRPLQPAPGGNVRQLRPVSHPAMLAAGPVGDW